MEDSALSMSSIEAEGREAYEAWQAAEAEQIAYERRQERAEAHRRLYAWRSRRLAADKQPGSRRVACCMCGSHATLGPFEPPRPCPCGSSYYLPLAAAQALGWA